MILVNQSFNIILRIFIFYKQRVLADFWSRKDGAVGIYPEFCTATSAEYFLPVNRKLVNLAWDTQIYFWEFEPVTYFFNVYTQVYVTVIQTLKPTCMVI